MDNYNHIIKGILKNNPKAQMAFYDLFFQPTYQSAYAIVGNSGEAEEIMQDTLMKVLLRTELLHHDADIMKQILKRIACNHAIDMVRKRKDFPAFTEDSPWLDDNGEDEWDEDELSIEEIKEGIEQLAPGFRSIISLRLFERISFSEIASQLKMNPSTVRVQYTRGIAKLRIYLKEKYMNYESA
ncbi:MAG: RNA polymerase sigma factor [Tannerella sp.]|jgi:RNA polymerase sigma-70 factor (ECF subfamily)|nr:RNA polymerase sigma factor [Tannerella sp.]